MKKDLLALGFVALLVFVLLQGTSFQSVEDYYLTHAEDITKDSMTVTLSIHCETVLEHYDTVKKELKKYIPKDGVVLKEAKYVLRPKDSVFDILVRATKANRIQMEYQGSDKNIYGSAYIQGINYLYEYSCGSLSGWMYKVNGAYPKYGCSQYTLKDKDKIEFVYTCDLGRDVGCSFKQSKK